MLKQVKTKFYLFETYIYRWFCQTKFNLSFQIKI